MPMRVIVTGPNGAGKSTFARALAQHWPEVPVISYDALKLTTDWVQRPGEESRALLAEQLAARAWILDGGPSLLPQALPLATAVVWLDPGRWIRGWRLALRPWTGRGRTRPELPPGNADWVVPQYRFALRSLRADAAFRASIARALAARGDVPLWHCRTRRVAKQALAELAKINR